MHQRSSLLTDKQEKMILANFNLRKVQIRQMTLPSNTVLIVLSNLFRNSKQLSISEIVSDLPNLKLFLVNKLNLDVDFLMANDNEKSECEIIITLK